MRVTYTQVLKLALIQVTKEIDYKIFKKVEKF